MFCIFQIQDNFFFMLKIKCEKNCYIVGVSKMKIKTLLVYFFTFLKRVCAVIFELDEVSISNFVKFPCQRMTLKIERVFEKTNQIFSKKLAKMAMN